MKKIEISWAELNEMMEKIDPETWKSLQQAITNFGKTPGMTIGDVMKLVPLDETWSYLIATTEITRMCAEREMEEGKVLKRQFPDVKVAKIWFTNEDDLVCAICKPDPEEVELNDIFSNGYSNPPAHPGCRCWISTTTAV